MLCCNKIRFEIVKDGAPVIKPKKLLEIYKTTVIRCRYNTHSGKIA